MKTSSTLIDFQRIYVSLPQGVTIIDKDVIVNIGYGLSHQFNLDFTIIIMVSFLGLGKFYRKLNLNYIIHGLIANFWLQYLYTLFHL